MKPWTGIRGYGCHLAAIFSLLVILLAIGGEVLAAEKRSGELKVGLTGDLTILDPHMSTSAIDRHLYFAIYNTLVGLDPELRIVPELATTWEIPDPLTYDTGGECTAMERTTLALPERRENIST
jgi:ABC-type transport system substrate-binding protein